MSTPRLEAAGARERARYRRALRRYRYVSTAVRVVVSMPAVVLSGMIVARLGGLFGLWGTIIALELWLLSLVPVVDQTRAQRRQRLEGCVAPTPEQARRLTPAWREVVGAAGVPATDYAISVPESEEVRGSASDGRIIEISSAAVHRMAPAQLRALLAHELGHLLSATHYFWYVMLYWYALPLRALPVAVSITREVRSRTQRRRTPLDGMLVAADAAAWAAVIALLIWLFGLRGALVAIALLVAQRLATRAIDRRDEWVADRVAVDLGFGSGVVSWLREYGHDFRGERRGSGPPSWPDRLFTLVSTHPLVHDRIGMAEAMVFVRERDSR
ncbi:Peptidase family M48 [Nocardia otitidiscaviarum]|uniref:Peptidase family M48 n=1 Tax=Nocardia otitidiscaviarum TaxID=1823 RepID=A0A378Y8X4_9NOCA|nr:M48 family metalloprotease [Nocardia otitidiscaviarum]SUA73173.1 Peptidase family M48 [Nocardia otitidiscaviarum]